MIFDTQLEISILEKLHIYTQLPKDPHTTRAPEQNWNKEKKQMEKYK